VTKGNLRLIPRSWQSLGTQSDQRVAHMASTQASRGPLKLVFPKRFAIRRDVKTQIEFAAADNAAALAFFFRIIILKTF